jgi:hypothetical protein
MIEESTQPTRIVTADLKRISLLVASIAFPFHSCDGSHHSVSDAWIFCHFYTSPFTCFGRFMIFLKMSDRIRSSFYWSFEASYCGLPSIVAEDEISWMKLSE